MASQRCVGLCLTALASWSCAHQNPDTVTLRSPLRAEEDAKVSTVDATRPPQNDSEEESGPPVGMAFIQGGRAELRAEEFDIPSFYYDIYETTVADYRKCVDAGACTPPHDEWGAPGCSLDQSEYDSYPISCIDWYQADVYCRWAGKRLPMHYEWGWAARSGIADTRYPWGDAPPSCALANVDSDGTGCGFDGPWPVGTRPAGASRQGVHDLIGNVWEWTGTRVEKGVLSVGWGWPNVDWPEAELRAEPQRGYRFASFDGLSYQKGVRCAMDVPSSGAEAGSAASPPETSP